MELSSAGHEYNRRGDEALPEIDNMEKVLDDIILGDCSMHRQEKNESKFLHRCRDTEIPLNPKKIDYSRMKVKCAGFRVTSQGIQVDPEYIKAIPPFLTPKKISYLSFLGLVEQLSGFSDTVSAKFLSLRSLLSPKIHTSGQRIMSVPSKRSKSA
ncbi:uncharacterized protein [Lepeophtheirus salmonis]|uniref:uncharacterized protein n=1 Tax=Lepeophtheirus salmonis TaxID=72036 RepID=UPI003AF3BD37